MSALLDKLRAFADAAGDLIKDLANIDVITLTGDININIAPGGATSIDPTAVFEALKGTASGALKAVAVTHIELDMDATTIVGLAADDKLLSLHNAAVKTAIDTRTSVLEFLKGLTKLV